MPPITSRNKYDLNDDGNFETFNFRLENRSSDPDGLIGSTYYNIVSNSLKIKTNLGWQSLLTSDSLSSLDASNLVTGTVPLARLANITTAQLSATAGILSSQISGLDASKITGTFPLSLLNQGTTGQFLRGDGVYSNTLTGGLTLGGALAGATTVAASTSVTTPFLNPSVVGGSVIVGGNLAWNSSWVTDTARNSIAQTTGGLLVINTPSADQLYIRQAGVDKVLLGDTCACYGTGGMAFVGASTTQFTTQAPSIGSRNSVTLNLNAKGSVILENGGTASLTAASTAVTLGSHGKVIYNSAGTTTAANNEIVGAVGGLRYNVASGLAHTLLVANTAVLTLSSTDTTVAGFLTLPTAAATIRKTLNTGDMRLCGGIDANATLGSFIQLYGNTGATTPGTIRYIVGTAAGSQHQFFGNTGIICGVFSETGLAVTGLLSCTGLLRLGGTAPATATSAGTAGQIAWDASGNIYICSATNTWRRVATSTF